MTPDGSPIIGRDDQMDGYLMAIGMCGQGFMFGPGVGELLTRMVMQKDLNDEDQQILHILSPKRVIYGQRNAQVSHQSIQPAHTKVLH